MFTSVSKNNFDQMTALLTIRLIQLKRELDKVGPSVLVIFGIVVFLIYTSFELFKKNPDAYYLTTCLFLVCLSIQFYRTDKTFVYNHIYRAHLSLYWEYVVLVFPFSITGLFTQNYICVVLLFGALYLLPFLKHTFKQRSYFKNISSLIPAQNFELISGFRKSFLYIIPLYGLAIIFCWVRIFPLFVLWFITIIISSFYKEYEPLHIIREGDFSTRQFLHQKLYQNIKWLLLLHAPILLLNTFFNAKDWFISLLFIFTQIALLFFTIGLKYSNYEPNKNAIANNTLLFLVAMGCVVPYLLPIPILMAFNFYKKAKNNLDNYLYA
jgi:hypothetical protein